MYAPRKTKVLPVFQQAIDNLSVNINTAFSRNLPKATISTNEALEYVFQPNPIPQLAFTQANGQPNLCLLYTSPSPRDS